MAEYCENCGAKLRDDSKFCQECGHNVEEICPKCGANIEDSENFCDNCGANLNEPEPGKINNILDKYRLPIIIVIIAIIAVIAFVTVPMIIDYSSGSQIVNVDGYDFKIPGNFNESSDEKAVKEEYGGISRHWKNGDEYIEIWILPSQYDAQSKIASLGGSIDNKYGYTGYHNVFRDGGEEFGFERNNNEIYIFVSDPKLFDRIEVL